MVEVVEVGDLGFRGVEVEEEDHLYPLVLVVEEEEVVVTQRERASCSR